MSSPESVEAFHPEAHTWHVVPVDHVEGSYIAASAVSHWNLPDRAAEFRLKLMAAHPAGFGACYVTSPTIASGGEGTKESEQAWTNVGENLPFYVTEHHLNENLSNTPPLDAVVQMSAPHQEPDRAALDAGAVAQRGSAILTCTTHETSLPSEKEEVTVDRYSDYLRHLDERFCASVQTFRANNASVKLVERGTLASILTAVAVSMLVQALVSRRRERGPLA